jgi:hypothetical protein
MARAAWLEDRQSELLPIPYFHVVFTLPQQLAPLALQNKRVLYDILFRAAAETLLELAADPKHLGAKIGCLRVLHSWGQTLMHHPHVHCLVTGGGISLDRSRWISCKQSKRSKRPFFVHAKILSRVFRGKFIDFLKRAFCDGRLRFHGKLAPLLSLTPVNMNSFVTTRPLSQFLRSWCAPNRPSLHEPLPFLSSRKSTWVRHVATRVNIGTDRHAVRFDVPPKRTASSLVKTIQHPLARGLVHRSFIRRAGEPM